MLPKRATQHRYRYTDTDTRHTGSTNIYTHRAVYKYVCCLACCCRWWRWWWWKKEESQKKKTAKNARRHLLPLLLLAAADQVGAACSGGGRNTPGEKLKSSSSSTTQNWGVLESNNYPNKSMSHKYIELNKENCGRECFWNSQVRIQAGVHLGKSLSPVSALPHKIAESKAPIVITQKQ